MFMCIVCTRTRSCAWFLSCAWSNDRKHEIQYINEYEKELSLYVFHPSLPLPLSTPFSSLILSLPPFPLFILFPSPLSIVFYSLASLHRLLLPLSIPPPRLSLSSFPHSPSTSLPSPSPFSLASLYEHVPNVHLDMEQTL